MELRANAVHQEGMRFLVTAGSHSLTTDYPLNADETGIGPRPLELLLGSPASCTGGAMVALLRRAGQIDAGLTVTAFGDRLAEHTQITHEKSASWQSSQASRTSLISSRSSRSSLG